MENIKYNCRTCGCEVETRTIGKGPAYWSKQCPYCYSRDLDSKTEDRKSKD